MTENVPEEFPGLTFKQKLKAFLGGAASIGGGMASIGEGMASVSEGQFRVAEGMSRMHIVLSEEDERSIEKDI